MGAVTGEARMSEGMHAAILRRALRRPEAPAQPAGGDAHRPPAVRRPSRRIGIDAGHAPAAFAADHMRLSRSEDAALNSGSA